MLTEMPKPPPLLDVIAVEVLPAFQLRLTFENGEVRIFDMTTFLSRATGVFAPLRDRVNFHKAFVANGTVCWPGNVDIDPELLYLQSIPEQPDTERRIGVAKGEFDVPDEPTCPRDPEWEAMPDVGLEAWPDYSEDAAAWALAQSRALRKRDVAQLDWDRLADEILDVAKSERRELGRRVSALMVSLAKYNLLDISVSPSIERLLREQRKLVLMELATSPSLGTYLADSDWLTHCWSDAIVALGEAGFSVEALPQENPWCADELTRQRS